MIKSSRGFTLLELIIVITLMGVMGSTLLGGFGMLNRYREDQFITDLVQTLEFVHSEAKGAQQFYQIEFDLTERSWHVGLLRPEDVDTETVVRDSSVGNLSFELADFINPPLGNSQSFMIPPDFPSLAKPRKMYGTATFQDIITPRGEITADLGEKPYIIFSPRGFTEFAVIHIRRSDETAVTLVINPFTGNVEIHEGYKEFKWQYETAEGL
jgi:prepilin-type N-terminal cleavage/methylation domain-containing protein